MASSYEDRVCNAVAAALAGIAGVQESAYMLANPTSPAFEVLPGQIEYDRTFGRGHDDCELIVRATVGTKLDKGAQIRLRELRDPAGANSLKAKLEADPTLGGLVEGLRVTKASPVRQFRRPDGGTVVLGCDFNVRYFGNGQEGG